MSKDISLGEQGAILQEVIEDYYQREIKGSKEFKGGKTHIVHSVDLGGGNEVIVRINTNIKLLNKLRVSKWAMEEARQAGVPVPECVYMSDESDDYVAQVFEKIDGVSADTYEGDVLPVWEQAGKWARVIHSIKAPGYGTGYADETSHAYYGSWKEYLDMALGSLFFDQEVWSEDEVRESRELLHELYGWEFVPRVIHRDLRLWNILVDTVSAKESEEPNSTTNGTGEAVEVTGIIDWDEVFFGPAPVWELATLVYLETDDPEDKYGITKEEIDAFCHGYGISDEERAEMEREIALISLFKAMKLMRFNRYIGNEWAFEGDKAKFKTFLQELRELS